MKVQLTQCKLGYGGTKEEMERLLADASKISGVEYDISSYADIVEAIHVVQTEMGITGTTAREAEATISGSINTLKASFENLLVGMGDPSADIDALFSNVTSALENVINNIMPVVQNVFNTVLPQLVDMVSAALPGLMDGIMSAAPAIVESLFGVLRNVVSQLAAKLPELVKGLMARLPEALRSILDFLPELIDMAFELATDIVTGLIEALPELIPMLVEGIVRIIPKIFTGVAKAVANIGASIWDMLMGSPDDMTERVNEAFNNIDTSGIDPIIAEVKAQVKTDVEIEGDPAGAIVDAVNTIRETIDGIEGLSDEEKAEITEAILSGSGIDAVQAAFDAMGIDSTVATQITQSMTDISNAIEGLGLSEEAQNHLIDMLGDDNTTKEDIEKYLTSQGVDPKVASDAAQTIYDADATMDDALSDLGFSTAQIVALKQGTLGDKKAVVAALKILGLSDADIETVTGSYDTAADTIYASAMGMYDKIEEIFTNGKADDEEEITAAKDAVKAFVDGAQEKVDTWYQEALADLDASGLSGAALEAARADVDAKYQSMTDAINEAGDAAYEYIDTNAGKSADACKAALTDLQGVLEQVGVIDAAISNTSEKAFGASGAKKRKWAEEGSQDREIQLYALAYTDEEYNNAIAQAEADREAAYALADENAKTEEEYHRMKEEADAAYEAAVAAAESNKKLHQSKILSGMLSGDPELQEQIEYYQNLEEDLGTLTEALAGVNWQDYLDSGADFDSWFESLGLSLTKEQLAEALGIDPNDFQGAMEDAMLKDTTWAVETRLGTEEALENEFANLQLDLADTETGKTIAAAVEEGWLEPSVTELGKYDYAGMLTDALDLNSGLEDAGEQGGNGLVTGLGNKETAVHKAAWRLGMSIKDGVTAALQIESPSKVMRKLGDFAGEGLDIGLTESVGEAVDHMRGMITGINMAPKMDLSSISGQLAMINDAQAEYGNVILQLNGRELGRAAAPDMNTAVNGYTRRIAMGYGRG